MPPFRLLHAAGLEPDAVFWKPPTELVDLCDDAPIAAVERLVSQAIERRADAVLITVNEDRVDGLSLQAAAALGEQFDRLQDQGIAAVLAIGHGASAWQALVGRESEVIVLAPGESTTVLDRQGRDKAVIRCVDSRDAFANRYAMHRQANDLLEIAVVPRLTGEELPPDVLPSYDYVAVGCGKRQTLSLGGRTAHCPDCLQATSPLQSGPRGATLVTIDQGSEAKIEFVPTASVRYESILVSCEANDESDDLALKMLDCLNERMPEPGEQAWIIHWTIEAAGALFESLTSPVGRSQLKSLLPNQLQETELAHRITAVPHSLWQALEQPIAAEFAAALVEHESGFWAESKGAPGLGLLEDAPHLDRLNALVGQANRTTVVGTARRFGLRVTAAATDNDTE